MPFIFQYIDSLSIRPLPFNHLKELVFDPTFRNSSSRALTLKGMLNGRNYSVKFFTSPDDGVVERYRKLREYRLNFVPEYTIYENEIGIVDGNQFSRQPVLLGEWIEGVSLSDTIKRLCSNHDKKSLSELCDKMINLFIELIDTDIIHGDLKFDNIIVGDDGGLSIVDWDAYYSTELKDYHSCELGTNLFQHPARCESDYGKRVDDYSIALMTVTMVAYSKQPELYFHSLRSENALLAPDEILSGKSEMYLKMCSAWQYYPLRSELLRFLAGVDFQMPALRKVLLRLVGRDKFDDNVEELIDNNISIRKIVNRTTKLYGYIDGDDNVVIDTMYGDCTMFGETMCGVRINGSWFFIDKHGRQLSDCYQKIIALGDGRFSVKKDNCWSDITEKEIKNL